MEVVAVPVIARLATGRGNRLCLTAWELVLLQFAQDAKVMGFALDVAAAVGSPISELPTPLEVL